MQMRTGAAATALLLTAAAGVAAAGAGGAQAATHPSHRALPKLVVTITSTAKGINLSDTKIRPGNTIFKIAPHGKRGGDMQVARLRHGYTLVQANKDLNAAFGGDVAAVKRVDHNIFFYGGNAMAPKGGPTMYWGVDLDKAGNYLVLNTDNNRFTTLKARGTHQKRALHSISGQINMATAADGVTNVFRPGKNIAKQGWMRSTNRAKEPHFVELGHVKKNTTDQMVQEYFQGPPTQGPPPFAAKDGAHAGTGIISPGKSFVWSYSLPKGKYLVDCFWPSIETGMPHALMGMFKLFDIG